MEVASALKLSIFISAFLTWTCSTTHALITVTYFEIDADFASTGRYNVCPGIEFGISTCQKIYPKRVSVCKGEGGYQSDVTGPPTIPDRNVTICCSRSGASDGSPYINATAFGNYLQGQSIEVLTTIGCDFTGGMTDFLQIESFKKIEVKSPSGVAQFEIIANDQATQNWVNDVAEGSSETGSSNSFLNFDPRLISYRRGDTEKIKSFSHVEKDGKLTTVTYLGT